VTGLKESITQREALTSMEFHAFSCPWCGETNEVPIDPGELGQVIVTDCRVCCRPIEVEFPDQPGAAPRVGAEGQ
jgi:hypothetical protein